jgi:hypothetical protein
LIASSLSNGKFIVLRRSLQPGNFHPPEDDMHRVDISLTILLQLVLPAILQMLVEVFDEHILDIVAREKLAF